VVETTHYELLGVSPDASPDEIKSAYRRAARRYHPDTNPDNPSAADHFKVIVAAYETLGNADRRADYDDALLHPDSSDLDGEYVGDGYVDADDVGNGFGDNGEGFATDGFATGDPQASGWYTDDGGFGDDDHAAGFTGHHGFGDDDPAAAGFAGNGRGGPMPDDGYATGWGDDLGNPTSAANRAHAAGRGEDVPNRPGADGWGDDTWAGRHDGPAPSAWFGPGSHGWGEDGDAEGEWFGDPHRPAPPGWGNAHPAGFDDGWVEPPPPGSHLIGPDGTTYIVDAHGVVYPIDALEPPGAAPFAPSGHRPLGWSPAPLGLGARVLQMLLVLVVMWVVDGIVGASVSNFAEAAGDWWATDHDARDVANDPDATPLDRVEAEAASEGAGADLRSETIRLLTVPVAGALAWPASYLLLRPRRHLHYG